MARAHPNMARVTQIWHVYGAQRARGSRRNTGTAKGPRSRVVCDAWAPVPARLQCPLLPCAGIWAVAAPLPVCASMWAAAAAAVRAEALRTPRGGGIESIESSNEGPLGSRCCPRGG
eukprot:5655994-Prymnesium_polylepis.1